MKIKCLSVREPYATAIREQLKHFETRNYKTNYRGELLIHSGKEFFPLNKEESSSVYGILDCLEMKTGVLHCKCKLVDCIKIDSDFIEKLKIENPIEYKLGFYKEGRYAWVLEGIEPFDINKEETIRGYPWMWMQEIN